MTLSKTLEFILFELAPENGLVGLNALYVLLSDVICIHVSLFIFP
jgi:hypothetical protein